MKLQEIFGQVKSDTELWISKVGIDNVKEYMELVKREKNYNNYEVRIANDIVKYGAMYHVRGTDYVLGLYDKYKCNDTHITTLCIKVMKSLNLL